jgi:microcystin-dependent protein
MSCQDCFNGCGEIFSDNCIKYTERDVPLLGLKTGDPLNKFEAAVVDKLEEFAEGQGIDLSTLDLTCPYMEELFDCCKDKNLINILQVLIQSNCTLKGMIELIEEKVGQSYSFNTACLEGLPQNPTAGDVLQAAIVKLCTLSTQYTTISSDYVKASDLNTLIAQYLTSTSGIATQQNTKMIPHVAYEYYGPLSNFDSSGRGISSVGFDKVYFCNGNNGTPDKRGRVAVGAIQGVPGGALDSEVDPTIAANAGTNYSLGQKFGKSFVTLNVTQIPSHQHLLNDPGHKHSTAKFYGRNINYGNENSTKVLQEGQGNNSVLIQPATDNNSTTSTTGITIQAAGGGLSHENRQPSIAANFIMYLP